MSVLSQTSCGLLPSGSLDPIALALSLPLAERLTKAIFPATVKDQSPCTEEFATLLILLPDYRRFNWVRFSKSCPVKILNTSSAILSGENLPPALYQL